MVKTAAPPKNLTRHQQFIHWLDSITEEWLTEWVDTIRREVPGYAHLDVAEIRVPVERHCEALRQYWDLSLQTHLYAFYQDLARKRISENVTLADVARAVAVGERLLLKRLARAKIPGKQDLKEMLEDTFREDTYMLLECFQSAAEEVASEAHARIEATRADAAKTLEQWGLLNQILSGMDIGIILLDRDLRVAWMNQGIPREILQVRPELAEGLACSEVLTPEAGQCSRCGAREVLHGGQPMRQMVRVGSGKAARQFLKITRPISGGSLDGPHVMEVYLDITAQHEVERSLARTQEFVRNILNSSVSGIISTDVRGRITLFNRAAERIFGFTEEEMLGRRVADYYEQGLSEARRIMKRLLHEEVITDYTTSFRDKWGAYVPLRVTFSLLKDEGGDISGTMCFCQDIRMEEALKKEVADKNQYLLSILQASTDGLVTLDRENRIASWNRGAGALFGVEAAFALGKPIEEFLPADAMRPAPAPANLPPETAHFEARLPRGCDTHADLLITRTAIHNASGQHAGASLVLKDITELKHLQKDLAEAEHLAELGRLAASVAHEIKNPIAGLRGAMEVMADTHELDNPRFTIFHEGLRQIRRLDSLVKDLLSFARPLALALEPVPLHMLAEASLAMVRVSAEEAGVRLHTAIPEDLPPAAADPQRLQQVIVNLVQNAVQATPAGGTVTVDAYPCNEEMALEVKDTGTGISPENMKNIFKPFFTTKHIGTGLGLSIVQRIVNAHGGRIEVGASEPQGTTFTVYLPRHSGGR